MAQTGQQPARDHLYADLGLGLVARFVGTGREGDGTLRAEPRGVGLVAERRVTTGAEDGACEVVRDDQGGTPPQNGQARVCEPTQSASFGAAVAAAHLAYADQLDRLTFATGPLGSETQSTVCSVYVSIC